MSKLVKFNNGKYGIRRGYWFTGYEYYGNGAWWFLKHNIIDYCQYDTLDMAMSVLKTIKPEVKLKSKVIIPRPLQFRVEVAGMLYVVKDSQEYIYDNKLNKYSPEEPYVAESFFPRRGEAERVVQRLKDQPTRYYESSH